MTEATPPSLSACRPTRPRSACSARSRSCRPSTRRARCPSCSRCGSGRRPITRSGSPTTRTPTATTRSSRTRTASTYCNGTEAAEGPAGEDALAKIPDEADLVRRRRLRLRLLLPGHPARARPGSTRVDLTGALFAGDHPNSVLSVARGDATVGVSFNDARTKLVEENPEIGTTSPCSRPPPRSPTTASRSAATSPRRRSNRSPTHSWRSPRPRRAWPSSRRSTGSKAWSRPTSRRSTPPVRSPRTSARSRRSAPVDPHRRPYESSVVITFRDVHVTYPTGTGGSTASAWKSPRRVRRRRRALRGRQVDPGPRRSTARPGHGRRARCRRAAASMAPSPRELRRLRAEVGMIFQSFNLVSRVSVLSNVLMGRLPRTSTLATLVGAVRQAEQGHRVRRAGPGRDHGEGVHPRFPALRRPAATSGDRAGPGAAAGVVLADEPVASLDPPRRTR